MSVAPVCRVGDPLQLTCTASAEFIRWNILQSNEHGALAEIVNPARINSLDANQMLQIVMNSTTFTFMRISTQGASPLVTTLSIDSVGVGLNGTVVNCTNVANPMTSASTTMQIIDTSQCEYVKSTS
jgi:glutamine phosphoribosylpyrophosphate amidotransferase